MLDTDISTRDALAHLHVGETDSHAIDRRRFLQLIGMGAGAGLFAGSSSTLLDMLTPGYDASAWAAGPIGQNDGVLLVIAMYGGNDGLNTVIPFNDGNYYTQHGGLAIPGSQTLALDGNVGLNPALTEMKRFWDQGQLAVVQGIGYENPDLSHFNSMAYWMAGRPNAIASTGWIGRWLDGKLGGTKDLYMGAEVGYSVPLHLIGNQQRGTAVPPGRPNFGAGTDADDLRLYQTIRSMQTTANGPWFGSVSQAFVDQLDMAATLAPVIPEHLPETDIVARLEVAARLINANLGFRVLTAGYGDFDNHSNQLATHPVQLQELNAALQRFFELLEPAYASRVTVMTFSEFGRTSWDNDGGTDHGTSAPHFVIGANVKGGMYGLQPSLVGLDQWDRMPYHVDFRSYYASILDGWMGGGSSDVLGGNFENLGLFSRGPGINPDGSSTPPAVSGPPSMFVPLTPERIADTRDGTGGVPVGKLAPGGRIRVRVAGAAGVPLAGACAVAVNLTVVEATEPMFATVYPGGSARPGTSNINGGPGRPVPNLVVMGVGTDGHIEVYNSHGNSHVLVDVFGYFCETAGDRMVSVTPSRLFDTRTGAGIRPGKLQHLVPVDVQVAGLAGVPAAGATAVVMNLTVTEPSAPGFLRMTPAGRTPAQTSNVNFFANDTVPNLVICQLGDGGRITLDSAGESAHALADVFGYFGAEGSRLRTMPPERLLDTRIGLGSPTAPIGPDRTLAVTIGGRARIPREATAVVLNVTATNVAAHSFITVWPYGGDMPATSNLNLAPGQTIANLVICRLGADGALSIGNPIGTCDVIADALGYFVD